MMLFGELSDHCHVLLCSRAVRQCHVSRLCKQLLECSVAARHTTAMLTGFSMSNGSALLLVDHHVACPIFRNQNLQASVAL